MSYLQKKVTGSDKKIQDLKTQLYGKQYAFKGTYGQNTQTSFSRKEDVPIPQMSNRYLSQDLAKSFILATLVIIAQFLIFLGNSRSLIKF